jgi:Zinc carboxypeptidase
MKSILLFVFSVVLANAQNADTYWQTYYEKSDYKKTPSYDETIEYCKKLADVSNMIHYSTFGKSPQGRDIPLLIVDKNGNFLADAVHKTGNAVFMIQAGIHAGEIDGKDAGLMLIRDMVIFRKNIELLDNVTLLFIPIFNVDGHERFGPYNRINQNGPEKMGWRTTAQNYNLNRDYIKADSPEMQAFLKLYNEWLPDFFADCHVTDGADYQYVVTYSIETQGIQDDSVSAWIDDIYLPSYKSKMQSAGFPVINYVTFRNEHDPQSGMEGGVATPRFSTAFSALHNKPALLIETHMLKNYKSRVDGTYATLKTTIEILNRECLNLKKQIKTADMITRTADFRKKKFPLTFKLTNDSTILDFLGYKYTQEKSDLSGGAWFRYSQQDTVFKIPYFDYPQAVKTTRLPEAYIIPPEWTDVINRIKMHGIEFQKLEMSQNVKVASYKFSNVRWSATPYENHHTVKFNIQEIEQQRKYPAGSVVIPMSQNRVKIIANILEPDAPDSYVFWGFFDPIFEEKEYAESYVMEELARFMLASDENLKQEFEEKKATDAEFAKDPGAILKWFYQRSPYWDEKLNIYPVGRIFDANTLNNLLK